MLRYTGPSYRPNFLVGMDPGSKGCVVVLPSWDISLVTAYDLDKHELYSLFDVLSSLKGTVDIFLENPGYMPRDSVKALGMSKLARSVGQLEGIIASLGKTPTLVTAPVWQRGVFGVTTKGDKGMTHRKATEILGTYLRVTHINADALLIAYYGRLLYSPVPA